MPRAARTLLACLFICLSSGAWGKTILVYGDSLSTAYGIAEKRGWVALLGERLKREQLDYNVVNASISGETTSGGLNRSAKILAQHKPAVVILELGGNDGLRGLPIAELRANLGNAIQLAQKHAAKVLLVGMRLPTNYGTSHTREFHELYPELGRRYQVPVVPFLLEGVATDPALMQADGVHPTTAAQPKLLATVWPYLAPMLQSEALKK